MGIPNYKIQFFRLVKDKESPAFLKLYSSPLD